MKKLITLIIFTSLFIILANAVNGAQCSRGEDDTILALSTDTNAHAALYNNSNDYANGICYSTLFNAVYSGANPHNADVQGSNKILKLSANINAHAGTDESWLPAVALEVFYGDLICRAVNNSITNCASDEKCIVKLSDYKNAHLELCSQNNYPVSVCCKRTTLGPAQSCTQLNGCYGDKYYVYGNCNGVGCCDEITTPRSYSEPLTQQYCQNCGANTYNNGLCKSGYADCQGDSCAGTGISKGCETPIPIGNTIPQACNRNDVTSECVNGQQGSSDCVCFASSDKSAGSICDAGKYCYYGICSSTSYAQLVPPSTCSPGDGCALGCDPEDADCTGAETTFIAGFKNCGADGFCVEGCTIKDIDCDYTCAADDGCKTGCATSDPDCSVSCTADDTCKVDCDTTDPDCIISMTDEGSCNADSLNICRAYSVSGTACSPADPDCSGSVSDYDRDSMPNDWEWLNGLNPLDASDAYADNDNDGLLNIEEAGVNTNPNDEDSDDDGLTDYEEVYGVKDDIYFPPSDPNLADTDSDGLTDYEEVVTWGTDPTSVDTDGDGVTDGDEIEWRTDPLDSNSHPSLNADTGIISVQSGLYANCQWSGCKWGECDGLVQTLISGTCAVSGTGCPDDPPSLNKICGTAAGLRRGVPFFTAWNTILTIAILVIVYYLIMKNKKKRK